MLKFFFFIFSFPVVTSLSTPLLFQKLWCSSVVIAPCLTLMGSVAPFTAVLLRQAPSSQLLIGGNASSVWLWWAFFVHSGGYPVVWQLLTHNVISLVTEWALALSCSICHSALLAILTEETGNCMHLKKWTIHFQRQKKKYI